jgi:hypothetical protein
MRYWAEKGMHGIVAVGAGVTLESVLEAKQSFERRVDTAESEPTCKKCRIILNYDGVPDATESPERGYCLHCHDRYRSNLTIVRKLTHEL